jgi:AraC-like DNA-binding protein
MHFRTHRPGPPLCEFIEDFWFYDGYLSPHARERILPSGTFELVFNLREDQLRIYDSVRPGPCRRFSGAVFSGPYAGFFGSDAAEEVSIMGVHFSPGGAFPFLGVSAGDLGDTHVDLSELWKARAAELHARLVVAATVSERFRLLQQALVSRLFRPLNHHAAVATALYTFQHAPTRIRTRELADDAGLSERRFIDVFRAEVGMTPKLFARVHRFNRVLATAREVAAPDWAELAFEYGYFDQSHLIRDFVAFSGISPADYVRRQTALRALGAHMKRNHLSLAP